MSAGRANRRNLHDSGWTVIGLRLTHDIGMTDLAIRHSRKDLTPSHKKTTTQPASMAPSPSSGTPDSRPWMV
jgi:hypothetical protein